MTTIEIDPLLKDITPDFPCGENLEYDGDFALLEQSIRGKAEQQFGNTIIPAEEPDWGRVRQQALDLLKRTRDLRVIEYLARAALRTHGYPGLDDALTLLRRALEQYWETIHPQLDPEDDNDPTARINIIGALCDPKTMLTPIRLAPLVQSRMLGRFGLRDIRIASGEIAAAADMETPPNMQAIEAAFLDSSVDELQATARALRSAGEQVRAIEDVVTEKVGTASAASLDPLSAVLKEAAKALGPRLDARGIGQQGDAAAAANGHAVNGGVAVPDISGKLQSREDVIRMLDRICEYYERQEPSSPVPLLLQRAKKLVPMNFMEIVMDLIPDAAATAEMYRGKLPE
jgi:type VI secretion system protein ImpA